MGPQLTLHHLREWLLWKYSLFQSLFPILRLLMADLISAREMLSVFMRSSSSGFKTVWWIGDGRFSTS